MTSRSAHILCGAAFLLTILPAGSIAQRVSRIRSHPLANQRRQLPELLRHVVSAAGSLRITGERVVDQRVQGSLVRHSEIIFRIGNHTRITFPEDSRFSGQIIVDDGTTRRRYNPRNSVVTEQPSQRDDTLNRLLGPKNQLLAPPVALYDGGLIAGVHTTLASILDRNGSRVQDLYVDPNTGAVLKRVGYDKTGAVVANYEYTRVSYNLPNEPRAFAMPTNVKRTVTPAQLLRNVSNRAGLPAVMIKPGQGFNLVNGRIQMRGETQVLHQVYLGPNNARLSVFVLRAQVDPARLAERSGKLINAYSTSYEGATIVFIGPYPQELLRRLANTLVAP